MVDELLLIYISGSKMGFALVELENGVWDLGQSRADIGDVTRHSPSCVGDFGVIRSAGDDFLDLANFRIDAAQLVGGG